MPRLPILLVLPLLLAPASLAAQAAERPNLILIVTDDQGYGDFGFAGNPVIRTPNLNEMAAASARMERFYVSPVCAPTRASLMTGRYNYRTRVVDTYLGRAMMEPEEVTVAELLREAGYATGIFGKWHLGDSYPMRPMDQGFEESLVHRGGGIGQPSDPPGGEGRYTDPILFHNGEPRPMEGYITDVLFDEAGGWLERVHGEGRPFFLYLATNAPHDPYHDVPRELYEEYRALDLTGDPAPRHADVVVGETSEPDADRLARILAMITNIDENVGRLFARLERRGLLENTLVVFLVDNGPNTRRYVGGMRGMKGEVYEGGIRSPLWLHWPAALEPGHTSDRIAAHIDVMPTLLDAAGVSPAPGVRLDGRSLLPLLRRERRQPGAPVWPERRIFIQSHRGDEPTRGHHFAALSQRWKLVRNSGFGRHAPAADAAPAELYDLWADPLETRDVAAGNPEVVAAMIAAYDAWFDDVGATRADNYAPPRIRVGAPEENPVVLTRQDWRYPGERGGWDRNARGHWLLRVVDPGPYDLLVRFGAGEAGEVLRIRAEGVERQVAVEAGTGEVVLRGLRLPLGEVRLDAVLEGVVDGGRGVHQVELRR